MTWAHKPDVYEWITGEVLDLKWRVPRVLEAFGLVEGPLRSRNDSYIQPADT